MNKKLVLILIILILFIYNFTMNISISHFTNRKPKVAVCFYGLTRSLKYTIDSIKTNILKKLDDAGIDYDIILHTYDLQHLKLIRSGENSKLDVNEWKLLNPKYHQIDNQEEFDKSYNYEYVKSFGDAWNTNFQNTYNLIRQFNSLQKVWQLSEKANVNYDCYLFLRPDLKYTTPLDTSQIIESMNNHDNIYTPSWSVFRGYNDRMSIGSKKSMKVYANRIDEVNKYLDLTKKPLHAERFLKHVLDKNKLKNKEFKMVGKRVRTDGSIARLDKKL